MIYILINILYFNVNIFIKHISSLLSLINMLCFIDAIWNNIIKINYLLHLLNALNNNI